MIPQQPLVIANVAHYRKVLIPAEEMYLLEDEIWRY